MDQFQLSLCVDLFFLDSLCSNIYNHMKSEDPPTAWIFNLQLLTRWQWKMTIDSKFIQLVQNFLHFPDLNPKSYDYLNNMKLDLNVSTKQDHI